MSKFLKRKHAVKAFEVHALFVEVTEKLGVTIIHDELTGLYHSVIRPGSAGWGFCRQVFMDLPVTVCSVQVMPDFENGTVDLIPLNSDYQGYLDWVFAYDVPSLFEALD